MRHEIDIAEFSSVVQEFAAYKLVVQGCSQRTVDEYLLDLRTFFRYLLCKDQEDVLHNPEAFSKVSVKEVDLEFIRSITTEQIYAFLLYTDSVRENRSSAKARKLSAIKALYKFLINKRGLLEDNPAANIDTPIKKKSLPKYLTVEESLLLLNTVAEDKDNKNRARNYAIMTLFLNCGVRVGELTGISVGDLDPELRSMRVVGKGNKERIVYLNAACRNALSSYLAIRLGEAYRRVTDKALFLSNRNSRISEKTVQHMVYKYLEMAGLGPRRFSVHKLRHTAATLMYQSGEVDIRVLKDILGHEQLNTTQIYTHLSSQEMQTAMEHNPLSEVGLCADTPGEKDKPTPAERENQAGWIKELEDSESDTDSNSEGENENDRDSHGGKNSP
jgi:site-specific recombinase XerD